MAAGETSGNKKTIIAETLRRRILTMEIAPGSIIDEQAIIEEFSISKPPIREIIQHMAGEGYITLETNRPARAAPMGYHTLRDFFRVAPMIYKATAQLAAENATPAEIDNLKRIQLLFRKSIDDNDRTSRVYTNDLFHLEIGNISGSTYLMPSLRRVLIDHSRIAYTYFREGEKNGGASRSQLLKAADEHDSIIAAIEAGDGELAGDVSWHHLETARANTISYVVPEGMDALLAGRL